jgi:mevalonate kinase
MYMSLGTAPGKVIILGEHAVVYGRPAVAVPVSEVRATAQIESGKARQGLLVVAPDLGHSIPVFDKDDGHPLSQIVRNTMRLMKQSLDQDLTVTVTSTVPIARGMGSGAAVSTAIVRALAEHFNHWLPSQAVSDLVYEAEVLYHGTPSGIDNAVVSFEKPVYFVRASTCQVFWVGKPFLLVIADSGIESSTKDVVADLRNRNRLDPDYYEPLFDGAGAIAKAGRKAIELGYHVELGRLMNENHLLLQQMGVSSDRLDRLVAAARQGGALGAKMSGAGWGGNVIALVTPESRGCVDMMLRLAGATDVILTEVR